MYVDYPHPYPKPYPYPYPYPYPLHRYRLPTIVPTVASGRRLRRGDAHAAAYIPLGGGAARHPKGW